MSNFELPARPWGEKEIAYMRANEVLLDNETRVELGLKPSEAAPEPVDTPSEGEGDRKAPETPQTGGDQTPANDGEGKTGDAPKVDEPSTGDANQAPQTNTGSVPENTQG